jgi:L-arabinose transport system ATP-binding protein
MEGKPLKFKNIAHAIRNGVMLCPEDRKHDGIIPVGSVADNINLSARRHWSKFGFFLNQKMERQNANAFIERLRIKTPGAYQLVRNLSGGNQQKVILARWLGENIKVLLMDEPTRGIDVGAKHEIYNLMYELADQGVSIMMVSSDLPEILGVSDRIIVMREGTLIAEFSRNSATQERILEMALPVTQDSPKDVDNE